MSRFRCALIIMAPGARIPTSSPAPWIRYWIYLVRVYTSKGISELQIISRKIQIEPKGFSIVTRNHSHRKIITTQRVFIAIIGCYCVHENESL